MAWKGGFSVKSVDPADLQELVEDLESASMRKSRVAARDIPTGTIQKSSLSNDLQQELDNSQQLALRANSPVQMAGSIPKQALSVELQHDIDNSEGLAVMANSPVQMAGSIPAAAADLTDDWSFKRLGLHVGTTISSSGSVSVGAGTFYLVATAGGHVTVGLPAAATCTNMVLSFKKLTAANNMILDANSTETIDGAETKTFSDQWSWVTIISNGTNWFIISQGNP
tara:strand:- start:131 stop:808 length:678 start_codon:yes stop_codon:yes gene_type:complete